MNKMDFYAIYDQKSECFNDPFLSPTPAAAMRMVENALEEDHTMARHAVDYVLFRVGAWNRLDGTLEGCEPHSLTRLSDLLPSARLAGDLVNGLTEHSAAVEAGG